MNSSMPSTRKEVSESAVNSGNQSTRIELLETRLNSGKQSTGKELSESILNPYNKASGAEMSESTMIPGNQTTRRELLESTLNTGNQATRADVSEYTINSSNQRTSTEQTDLTLNTDNQAAGIDSRPRELTIKNVLNQETVSVQANLVEMKHIAMVNTGKQNVIINQSDEGSVHEAVGEIENRISQDIDDLKQTMIHLSTVVESQSKEIKRQREVMKQLTDREKTKAKIVWGTRDDFVPTKAFEDAKTKLLQQKIALSKLEPGRCAALLYLFLCGGRVLEKDLDPSNDKIDKTLLEEVFDVDLVEVKIIGQLGHKKKVQFIHESLDCLSGSLVTKEKLKMSRDNDGICYRFSHDSLKDTVALLYGEVTPIGFIQNCHCNSLCYITTSKTTPNKIFIDPENYIYMYRRLLRELECKQSNYKCIASTDIWDDIQFMSGFFRLLKAEGIDKDLYLKWTTKDVDGSYHFYTDRGDKYKGPMYFTESDDSDSSDSSDMYFPSFLVYVAHTNNLRLLKQLLKRTPKDHPQLQCVLFGAVRAGHIGVFKMIIKKGISTVRAGMSQSSHYVRYINVLHEACLFERVEMVTKLTTKYPSLVHDTCRDGIFCYKLSTLHIVVLIENCSLFDTIETIILGDLSREDRVKRLIEMVNGHGMTVLGYSCCLCNRSNTMVLHLLHKYPELASIRDEDGWHCLHYIALWSNKKLFILVNSYLQRFYKHKGINYDMTTIVNNDGESVLDMAKIGFGDDEDMCSYLSQSWS